MINRGYEWRNIFFYRNIFFFLSLYGETLKHLLPENPVSSIIEDLNCYFHKLIKKVNITIYYIKLKIILVWISTSLLKDMWYKIALGLIIMFVPNANHSLDTTPCMGRSSPTRESCVAPPPPSAVYPNVHRIVGVVDFDLRHVPPMDIEIQDKGSVSELWGASGCLLETFKGTNLILYPIVWQETKFSKMTHEANGTVWVAYIKWMLNAYLNKLETLYLTLMLNDSGSREGLRRNIIQILIMLHGENFHMFPYENINVVRVLYEFLMYINWISIHIDRIISNTWGNLKH